VTAAHVATRLRRREHNRVNEVHNGTPGWVVWCPEFSYPPTSDPRQAREWLRLAETHGCPCLHTMRTVLISADGIRYRYIDRKDYAS
jgi:hypothetical protein